MKQIGLYFGSFNPVHNGHIQVAQHFLEQAKVGAVWFVLSPQNPLKPKATLWPDALRMALLQKAIENYTAFSFCDIEQQRPAPHYTIDTLKILSKNHPDCSFSLLLGTDNLLQLPQWKDYDQLLQHYPIYVYPRPMEASDLNTVEHPNIHFLNAPHLPFSATEIRSRIGQGEDVAHLMPKACWDLLQQYKNTI